jgi:hypothetical protein
MALDQRTSTTGRTTQAAQHPGATHLCYARDQARDVIEDERAGVGRPVVGFTIEQLPSSRATETVRLNHRSLRRAT